MEATKINCSNETCAKCVTDLLTVGVQQDALSAKGSLACLPATVAKWVLARAKEETFRARPGELLKLAAPQGLKANWLVLVGLGNAPDVEAAALSLGVHTMRLAKAQASVAMMLPAAETAVIRAAVSGVGQGSYRFDRYLTGDRQPPPLPKQCTLLLPGTAAPKGARAAITAGTAVAESINFARDLVNAPANDLHPPALADEVKKACSKAGVQCKVWNKKQIEAAGMPLFLAVNRGSGLEPRLVHMHYSPKGKSKGRVVFVGKGLTFDAGGLCLKPAKSMLGMKCDMAGAATTAGVVLAAARLKLPVEVHGVIGATENMTGAHAYRPGDIFPSLSGKSVEIINTDAEGRLVLADVLAWATKLKPDVLIDHATLTGACMVALGPWRAGLYANQDALAAAYLEAAKAAGEPLWRMPLDETLRPMLKSDIADLKHTGESYGGSITAALFLREFIGDVPWLHLDIAGPAFLDKAHALHPKGGTGFGVATALRYLENFVAPKGHKTQK